MAVKKATVDSTMAKVEAAKAEVKKEAAPAKAAKKAAPAKKATPAKAATENVVIEFAGGQVATSDIVAKAVEVSGKKSIKVLNVYYQPETSMVYFTADGEEGSFKL